MPDEVLNDSIKKSMADNFITSLPMGLEYKIGVGGNKISGGERQRLALARTFAKLGEIILLDEYTSNIDIDDEHSINHIIMNEFINKTVLLITHKPYILDKVDRIVVLNKGKIVNIGRHKELMTNCELYQNIINSA